MRYLALVLVAFHLTASSPASSYRQDLASETFNFLYAHALCVEGSAPPCDWVYDGAYQMHWAAKQFYGTIPLRQIAMPDSVWEKCGYKECANPLTALEHVGLKWRMWLLINYGIEVPAEALAKLNR